MKNNFRFGNSTIGLPILLKNLLSYGREVGSRDGATKELAHIGISLDRPWERELLLTNRKHNIAAQIAETMWVLSGRNDVEWLSNYLPRAADFSDDGATWRAGYGPRLRAWPFSDIGVVDQLGCVVQALQGNPGTRQAVMSIWDPSRDWTASKDIPCNNWLSWLIRDGKLDLHVAVRSNDAMWGWSGINVFEWSALLEIMAGLVGVQMGELHFSVTSFHLYDRHWERAEKIIEGGVATTTRSTGESPRFKMPPQFDLTVENLDHLFTLWFNIEEDIRKGAPRAGDLVDNFPEPMLRSWLRVIAWWWTGDWHEMRSLEGTRLFASAQLAVQPKFSDPETVYNLLLLIMDEIPGPYPLKREEVDSWVGPDLDTVARWASSVHLAASDNGNKVLGVPQVLLDRKSENVHHTSDFLEFVNTLHADKHQAYGNSWKRRGEMLGIMANIARKIDRLGSNSADETSTDTAIDLLVYLAKYRWWLVDEKDAELPCFPFHYEKPYSDHVSPIAHLFIHVEHSLTWEPLLVPGVAEKLLTEDFEQLEHLVTMDRDRVPLLDSMILIAYQLARTLWEQ